MLHNKTPASVFPSCFLSALMLAGLVCAAVTGKAQERGIVPRRAVLPKMREEVGIDVLEAERFAPLRGKHVGVITNQTGIDAQARRTIDLLAHAPDVTLVAIFSPEHGISGSVDEKVADATDSATKLPIYSLYGEVRRPTPEMLRGIDALVYDIQDAGVRFYTFITTLGYCMEAAGQNHIAFYVLDRPDPLGGEIIEGPMLDAGKTTFTAYFPLPVRYAMTPGELAQMYNAENHLGVELHVIEMKNWRRAETYDDTGLGFVAPSPNLRSTSAVFLYPGLEILQAGGVSVGRGTRVPFHVVGAPWIKSAKLAAELTRRKIPGVVFDPIHFTPADALYNGQVCEGVLVGETVGPAFRSMVTGLEIAAALHKLYPDSFQLDKINQLLESQSTIDQLERGVPVPEIIASWEPPLAAFRAMREKYLLYN